MTQAVNLLENIPVFARVRRNHGIEHAAVHILTARRAGGHLVARSNSKGFVVFGQVEIAQLESAVQEALVRLQKGEAQLAVHPNCGTNFVASGLLTGLAAWAVTTLSSRGEGRRHSAWEALPTAFTASTLALFLAQPVGHTLQQWITTSPQVQGVRLGRITRRPDMAGVPVHFVELIHP